MSEGVQFCILPKHKNGRKSAILSPKYPVYNYLLMQSLLYEEMTILRRLNSIFRTTKHEKFNFYFVILSVVNMFN